MSEMSFKRQTTSILRELRTHDSRKIKHLDAVCTLKVYFTMPFENFAEKPQKKSYNFSHVLRTLLFVRDCS